jgi:predicted Ser/Thr protein kinase
MHVLTYNALAKAWDVLMATKREVSEVKQNIVLTHSSVYIVDYR